MEVGKGDLNFRKRRSKSRAVFLMVWSDREVSYMGEGEVEMESFAFLCFWVSRYERKRLHDDPMAATVEREPTYRTLLILRVLLP